MATSTDPRRARLQEVKRQLHEFPSGGGYENFTRFSDLASEMNRLMYELHHCYGEPYQCISCGCSKGAPCISHKGSPIYANELLERIANASEPTDV